jgi:hypothetical protein
MKRRRKANQLQTVLFDEQYPSDGPGLLEIPKDRNLDLEAAVSELLLKAAGHIDREKEGGHDA